MSTFASLGIAEPILSALTDYGYEEPTAIQTKAIPAGIAGRDVLGSAQTGTGKTCAFGVPILQRLAPRGHGRDIRALILTPTRELAIQIDDNLHAYGKNLPLTEAVIFGGVGQAPQVEKLQKGVDILTATPGRLLDLCGQGLLDLSRVEIFVLDEADRMLDMGFIHDVRKVIRLLPEKKQTMFFSATLPPEIMDLVDSLLHDPVKVAAAPVSSPVEIIRQEVCLVDRKNKTALLLDILRQEDVRNALVFTRTKHGADKVARDLTRRGVAAAAIHGNKSQTARQESLRKFKEGQLQVLVATDIAARGLDIEDLAYVFNYNLSEVPETYIHRIGRTGRAGKGGTAISFCDYGEMPLLRDIEKLLKKPVPRRQHDYPMEVFEVPTKDAKGRVVNPEDAEARQAAREKHAQQRKQAAEKAAEKAAKQAAQESPEAQGEETPASSGRKRRRGKGKGTQQAAPAPAPAPEAPKKERRTYPHGKQNLGSLEDFLAAQPTEEAPDLSFHHRDPLEGDVIMDATARLLAAKPVYHYYKPNAGHGRHGKGEKKGQKEKTAKAPKAPQAAQAAQPRKHPKKGAPAPAQKGAPAAGRASARSNRGRGRIPPRPEPPKSRQKDSTEQKSLMKPFYIDHD
ncbi:MAG TPA: DEAD/DEAH box helicase [Candidatus Evtepia faecigallinarum]|nr:DEAD/DEAH box helicase [Candidatus Evtepia faecigallinarum]